MMRKLLFLFILILGCFLASCHKDSNFEGREPSVLNDTVEVYAERAVFRWEVDYPGKIGSVVELGTDKEFSDGERYGEEQVIDKKQFEVEVDSLADGKSYYYRYVVWNRFDTYKTEAKRFTTTALLVPTVETDSITEVSYTSAVCHGEVSADGGAEVTSRGFCYALHENPTMADSVLLCGEGMGAFEGTLTGLAEDTRYYVKAFATNRVGTVYGSQKTFTTLFTVSLPEVTTLEVTDITQTTATGGGNVTSSGNSEVTERGICWSTSHNPTTSGNHASSGTVTGSYTVNMTGLTAGTTYYVRAYAKNSAGTAYGSEVNFTTLQNVTVPTVTTNDVSNITQTSATGGGDVTATGNATVTERGICWSTSHNPTTSGSHASSGTGTGSYTVNMTGLTAGTTYYVRAYAKNSAGTAYGSEVSFSTLTAPTAPIGAIDGLFSVSDSQQVYFSKGNLQYIGSASTPYWKFADHQWDYLGGNGQGSSYQNVDRDLFGWGTSGYYHGAVCYQPWSTSTTSSDYYAYGSKICNLYVQTGQADWGYNAISNGGNTTHTWRTLTYGEWGYVFNTRNTPSGIRYAKAKVNNVNGVILLPDDWQSSYYSLSSTNSPGASYSSNNITATQWATLEQHGAVFLPAAGYRLGTFVRSVGSGGYYWSASCRGSDYAWDVHFSNSSLSTDSYYNRGYGRSVRLVLSPQ